MGSLVITIDPNPIAVRSPAWQSAGGIVRMRRAWDDCTHAIVGNEL